MMEAQVILTRLGKYSTLIWRRGDMVRLAIPGRNKYKKLSQKLCAEVYDGVNGLKCGSYVIHEDCEDINIVKVLC
jgi:hypothetical protein